MMMFISAILILSFFRIWVVFHAGYPLQVDEAQYAGWAHALDVGYYSKPPLIAWMLHAGQLSCEALSLTHVEGCTRMLQAPAFALTAIFICLTSLQLFNSPKAAYYSGILFLLLPLTAFYSIFATTDAWLLLCWSVCLYLFSGALRQPQVFWRWILIGLFVGLGILAKYAMLLFLVGGLICLRSKKLTFSRQFWFAPCTSLLVAFLVFLPNLLWNISNGFPTFSHHIAISHLATSQAQEFHIGRSIVSCFNFVLSQAIVFGPLALLTLISSLFYKRPSSALTDVEKQGFKYLAAFIWPFLILMTIEALMSRAFANWALASYPAATILVGYIWAKHGKQFVWRISLFAGIAISIMLALLPTIAQHQQAENTLFKRPLKQLQGWREVALWAKQYEINTNAKASNAAISVVSNDRHLQAALAAYDYPQLFPPYTWNPQGYKNNHYQWFYDAAQLKNGHRRLLILIVDLQPETKMQLEAAFDDLQLIQDKRLAQIKVGKASSTVSAFSATQFKGYP